MANIKAEYGTSTVITVTPDSLGSFALRESTAIDNSTNKFLDAFVGGKLTTGTSPTVNTTIVIYAYGSVDGGSTYTGGATGSDAAYSALEEVNMKVLVVISVTATSNKTYEFGPVSVARLFGGHLPTHWGIIIENRTGVALNATGSNHEVRYQGIYETV